MIITVDIGNSRIKWAAWQADTIVGRGVEAYTKQDKREAVLEKLFSTVKNPSHVFAVCVADSQYQLALEKWSRRHWQRDVEYLKTSKHYKTIINAYDDPSQHGADRWAAVVASHQHYPYFSICVISAGTAITFDLIEKNGVHRGGYILPSYGMMHRALLVDTTNVKSEADAQFHPGVVPDNTNDAVNQGLHKLLQAGIRALCEQAEQAMEAPVKIVICGGAAEMIMAYPGLPTMIHEPDLVMQGLYEMLKNNKIEGE